jgi:DNA (cytosine-5)-methyltransferase 1
MCVRVRAAEFFAGIGLVREGLEHAGIEVAFANDIEPLKAELYGRNYGLDHFRLDDVRNLTGSDIPAVEIATASFPCTDLSLAGNRAGLTGSDSSMFWEFARVLGEMASLPEVVLLENVPSFATSRRGEDLRAAIAALNDLGYCCDLLSLDARTFVPQSRPRLFVVGSTQSVGEGDPPATSIVRPKWLLRFIEEHGAELDLDLAPLEGPEPVTTSLSDVVHRLSPTDARWWPSGRVSSFVNSLSPIQSNRLARMRHSRGCSWRTAFRRTRKGRAVWEMRADEIAGCLRTARGGSSKQALVEAGDDLLRIRWMTPREYARLQGVEDSYRLDGVSSNQALFGFGDAVCVPAITWVAENAMLPRLARALQPAAVG